MCELFKRMVQATYWYRGLLWPLLAKKVSFKVTLHVLDNQSKVSHILKYVGIHKMRGEKNHEPISIMRRSLQWSWPMTLPYLIFFLSYGSFFWTTDHINAQLFPNYAYFYYNVHVFETLFFLWHMYMYYYKCFNLRQKVFIKVM